MAASSATFDPPIDALVQAMAVRLDDVYRGDVATFALDDSRPILGAGATGTGGVFGYYYFVDAAAHKALVAKYGKGTIGLVYVMGAALERGLELESGLPSLVRDIPGGPRSATHAWVHADGAAWLVGTCMPRPRVGATGFTQEQQAVAKGRLPDLLRQQIEETVATWRARLP